MTDKRSRDEKRSQNLEAMKEYDKNYEKTESYQKTRKELDERVNRSYSAGTSSEPLVLAQGTYRPGELPFEQIQKQKGEFYESAKRGLEGIFTTERYNPTGLAKAMSSSPEEYPKTYEQARQKAVSEKIAQRNSNLFQQSALADLTQIGLFVSQRKNGKDYLAVSEKGKNLGYENIYELEENAIWGSAFDFIFKDDVIYQYPEGTRKAIKETSMEEPLILESEGVEYLLVQTKGKDTIKVKPINPERNELGETMDIDVKKLLDLSHYDVSETATFGYELREGGIKVNTTGVKAKSVGDYTWEIPSAASVPSSEEIIVPSKASAFPTVTTDALGNYVMKAPLEAENKFINPQSIPYNPASTSEYNMFGLSTPTREFFWADYSEGARESVSKFENTYLKDVRINVPGGGSVRPSDIVGFTTKIPETIAKGLLAPLPVGIGVAARMNLIPGMTQEEKDIAAGTGLAATFGGLIYTPSAATFFMTIYGEAELAKQAANTGAVVPSDTTSRGIVSTVHFGDTSDELILGYQSGVSETHLIRPELNLGNIGRWASFEKYSKEAAINAAISDVKATFGGLPGASFVGSSVNVVKNAAIMGVQSGVGFGTLQTATELVTFKNPLEDKAAQKRIATATSAGFVIGFGLGVTGPAAGAFLKKAAELPGKYSAGISDVAYGAADTFAVPVVDYAGNKLIDAGSAVYGSAQKFLPKQNVISTPAVMPMPSIVLPEVARERIAFKQTLQADIRKEFKQGFIGQAGFEPVQIRGTSNINAFANIQGPQLGARNSILQMDAVGFREEVTQEAIRREAGRTKSEQFAALRIGTGVRPTVRTRELVGIFSAQQEVIGTTETPRLMEVERVHQRSRIRPPPELTLPSMPSLELGTSMAGIPKMRKKTGKTKLGYSPSLAGADLGIIEKKIKKSYSGIEVRGLPRIRRGADVLL